MVLLGLFGTNGGCLSAIVRYEFIKLYLYVSGISTAIKYIFIIFGDGGPPYGITYGLLPYQEIVTSGFNLKRINSPFIKG